MLVFNMITSTSLSHYSSCRFALGHKGINKNKLGVMITELCIQMYKNIELNFFTKYVSHIDPFRQRCWFNLIIRSVCDAGMTPLATQNPCCSLFYLVRARSNMSRAILVFIDC